MAFKKGLKLGVLAKVKEEDLPQYYRSGLEKGIVFFSGYAGHGNLKEIGSEAEFVTACRRKNTPGAFNSPVRGFRDSVPVVRVKMVPAAEIPPRADKPEPPEYKGESAVMVVANEPANPGRAPLWATMMPMLIAGLNSRVASSESVAKSELMRLAVYADMCAGTKACTGCTAELVEVVKRLLEWAKSVEGTQVTYGLTDVNASVFGQARFLIGKYSKEEWQK